MKTTFRQVGTDRRAVRDTRASGAPGGRALPTAFFITGTDTGVGKTYVTALLLAELRRQGIRAAAMKPIACGRDGRHDAEQYAALMNHEQPLDVLNPVYLRHPLAPSVAAKLERRTISLPAIRAAYTQLSTLYSPLFVEGAGGLLVPILPSCHSERSEESRRSTTETLRQAQGDKVKRDHPYFVADLARNLDLPVIIVARLGLGTINHTLLTVRQAQTMGLKVAGIILNDTTGRRGVAERTNIKVIPELAGVPLLGVVSHGKPGRVAAQICRSLLSETV